MLEPLQLLALAVACEQGRAKLEVEARLALLSGDGKVFLERCEQAKKIQQQAARLREMAQAA